MAWLSGTLRLKYQNPPLICEFLHRHLLLSSSAFFHPHTHLLSVLQPRDPPFSSPQCSKLFPTAPSVWNILLLTVQIFLSLRATFSDTSFLTVPTLLVALAIFVSACIKNWCDYLMSLDEMTQEAGMYLFCWPITVLIHTKPSTFVQCQRWPTVHYSHGGHVSWKSPLEAEVTSIYGQ